MSWNLLRQQLQSILRPVQQRVYPRLATARHTRAHPLFAGPPVHESSFVIKHARLVTMTGSDLGSVDDGAMVIRDGRIRWLGPTQDLPSDEARHRTIDAEGRCLTPGLIDCHTHLLFAGCRTHEFEQRLRGVPYSDIARAGGGIQATVRATRAASPQMLFDSGSQRLQQALASGVTTIEIKSGYGLTLEDEEKLLRVAREIDRTLPIHIHTTYLGAHSVPAEFAGRAGDYIRTLCERDLPHLARLGLIDSVDAFCERIAFSAAEVEQLFMAAKALQLPVRLHADQLSDAGATELAGRYAALSADHLEHTSDAGIAALARAGTVAVLLPGAFYTLRETRKPPVDRLREAGVPLAIATDFNPGTSPINHLPTIMNMAVVLLDLTPTEAWFGVTRHAAHALGCAADRGTLAVDQRADLVLWDVEDPCTVIERMGFGLLHGMWIDGTRVNNSGHRSC